MLTLSGKSSPLNLVESHGISESSGAARDFHFAGGSGSSQVGVDLVVDSIVAAICGN